MLDYRIHTFLTLYRQMNYRKTAELLNMTQPGVTQHIQFLEKTYGVRLFVYDGRTLRRTKDAEILKKHMDSMAAEERAMEREFVGEEKTALNVGATKTIGEFVILPTVKAFLADESHSLNLRRWTTPRACCKCWRMPGWTLPWWRVCLTEPAMPAACTKRSGFQAFAEPGIPLPEKRFPWRNCSV